MIMDDQLIPELVNGKSTGAPVITPKKETWSVQSFQRLIFRFLLVS
jgi:hypothetical protein